MTESQQSSTLHVQTVCLVSMLSLTGALKDNKEAQSQVTMTEHQQSSERHIKCCGSCSSGG